MIAYLRGSFHSLTPTTLVVECSGVGYHVQISLNTYSAIQNLTEGKLYIHQIIREDAHLLYGFITEEERHIFTQLITVSGVGPNIARVILSSYTAQEVASIINQGGVVQLKAVKGIGAKTAERIVVDLKGKILDLDGEVTTTGASITLQTASSAIVEESVGALKMLGYPEATSIKAVRQLLKESPALRVEEVIKLALKLL